MIIFSAIFFWWNFSHLVGKGGNKPTSIRIEKVITSYAAEGLVNFTRRSVYSYFIVLKKKKQFHLKDLKE